MKITIYELLGMIKDGKAPYKIKYLDKYYTYVKEDYEDEEENQLLSWLFQDYCVEYVLNAEVSVPIVESKKIEKLNLKVDTWCNPTQCDLVLGKKIDEVEILDEPKENKIEKLETFNDVNFYDWYSVHENRKKINEIIDKINKE